ncbi:hypothetical protein HOY80DRAFT_1009393 [Tuber brumale]|nr:hypothetical protein HOY80DRAFT_1009393 [Tuber brumale]
MPAFASLLKFTGVFSLGILSGVHLNFSTATLDAILSLPSASAAQRAFSISLGKLRQVVRPLEIAATASLFTAFLFGGRRGRHGYLIFTGLMPVLGVALEKSRMVGVEVGVVNVQTRKKRGGESVDVNGEVVKGGMEAWRVWGLVRGGLVAFGFAMGVVGIWGDGA